MKRDLERWSDKLTPEEERRIWSKMQGSIRKGKSRLAAWRPRLWLTTASVAAAAALVVVAIWQADLLTPDKTLREMAASSEKAIDSDLNEAETPSSPSALSSEAGMKASEQKVDLGEKPSSKSDEGRQERAGASEEAATEAVGEEALEEEQVEAPAEQGQLEGATELSEMLTSEEMEQSPINNLKAGTVTRAMPLSIPGTAAEAESNIRGGKSGAQSYSIDKQADALVSRNVREKTKGGGPPYPSLTGGTTPVNDELADDMYFRHYGANPFIDAAEDGRSTFGLDVDTGSYTICRRYIDEGHLPPAEAVRVEEFVNFFKRNYDPPSRDDFRIHLDIMPSPFAHVQDGSYWLLRIGIKGRVVDDRDRMPAQIVLVIDTSGSMDMENRLQLLKESMEVLLDELRPDDEVGIVEYGTHAREVLPLTPVSKSRSIYRAIDALYADGSTNAEDGLRLGYKLMRRGAREGYIHRIILCSDGVANVGLTGSDSILESVRRDSDEIMLSTIGFGMGNYNDVLMEQLADAGDGQYAYVDDRREAIRVLRENLTGTLQTIARDAKAQIEFYPNYVVKYRLLGYENRDVRDQDFRNDAVDAGEIGVGHEVTILYELKLQPKLNKGSMATVRLRYESVERKEVVELDAPVSPRIMVHEIDEAPADLVFDACVAEFAEILRGSYWAKEGSFEDVLDLLRSVDDRMASQPEANELLDLVKKAIVLEDNSDAPRRRHPEHPRRYEDE